MFSAFLECSQMSGVFYHSVIHSFLFFFYKNIVFPGQAEYSYFSADFRLKIFLYYSYIIGCDISVLEFIGISIKLLQVFGIWICIALHCAHFAIASAGFFALASFAVQRKE